MKRLFLVIWVLLMSQWAIGNEPSSICIVSYNAENLFHPDCDSINPDTSFTPQGERHWSYTRYYRKVENIARVLTNIGGWNGVDIVGLQEVESAACVKRLCYTLRRGEYDYVHYDSHDSRGIDVALIYRKAKFTPILSNRLPVDLGDQPTRDILYVCGLTEGYDTLHLLVCHLPSQLGGAAETEWKRAEAKRVLQAAVDSILSAQSGARIIVMGDMNSSPMDDIRGLSNRMMAFGNAGTHKHQGRWTCLDQFYTSPALSKASVCIYDASWIQESDEKYLGTKPKRCYIGYRYQDGFSDHLPIVMMISESVVAR
ncbi:MAG: endonuclease [Paludibacteraceae bacterium]|nr:endonuclease [Paludibacteraceae bacterium]